MYNHKIATRFSERTKKRHHAMRQVVIAQEAKYTQKPALLSSLPRYGAIAAVLPLLCLSAWAIDAVAVPNFLALFKSGPTIAVAIFASIMACVGVLDATPILDGKRRVEVLFHRTASWTIGETQEQCWNRMRSIDVTASVDCYPDEYPGKVISVRPVADIVEKGLPSLMQMADKDRPCVTLDLTDAEIAGLSTRTRKIDAETERPVAVTLDDRHGAILSDLVEKYGSREAVEVAEQTADIEAKAAGLTPEIPHEPHTFTLDVQRLRKALPPTVTHTGTGMYWVKAAPTHNDDTQSGAVAGQVVTLVTGGLGSASAYAGGYVTNATRSETRAIVSHTDTTVTFEGDLRNWLDTDDLDIYDAWSTIQAACVQLYTDQGTTEFTAMQYVRIFAGTYVENVIPAAGLNPDADGGEWFIIEGDPADDRTNINVNGPLTTFNLNYDAAYLRHVSITAGGGTQSVVIGVGTTTARVLDCAISSHVSGRNCIQTSNDFLLVADCVLEPDPDDVGVQQASIGSLHVRRCRITGQSSGYGIYNLSYGPVTVEACVFDSLTVGIEGPNKEWSPADVRNCTFYSCTYGMRMTGGAPLTLINNIFHTTTNVMQYQVNPDEASGSYAGPVRMYNNCFYTYTTFCVALVDRTYSEFIAQDGVDATGNLDATDPLMSAPAAGDFSLAAGSPCIHTGVGSGVSYDSDGNPFDPYHPDMGAVGTGIGPNVVYGS